MFRIGMGYDVHKLVEGRKLILGGIDIPHTVGLLGHSDADVLIHAICDALLGAANMRDIGYHFPDTSADTLDMDSKVILRKVIDLIATKGYKVGNIDATVCAERPKLNPHVPAMKACLAKVIGCDEDQHQGHHHGEARLHGARRRYLRLCRGLDLRILLPSMTRRVVMATLMDKRNHQERTKNVCP